jgi:hypothetical protein
MNRFLYQHPFWVIIIITGVFHLAPEVMAQNIPTGTWRDHLPYSRGVSVAATTGDVVYCATREGLFKYEPASKSLSTLSKINGLSDVGFSKIAWHKATNTLVVAYQNANIDLIRGGNIYNLSDIKRQNIPINKVINDITFHENEAWLSCGFGIVVLNLEKREFKETYLIGDQGAYMNINDVKFFQDTVYAATDSGIYRASMADYLPDFSNWSTWNDIPYAGQTFNTIAFFNGVPFLNLRTSPGVQDTIFYLLAGQWKHYDDYGYGKCNQLDVHQNKLVIAKHDHLLVLDDQLQQYRLVYDYTLGFESSSTVVPYEAVVDEKGFVWIADHFQGLVFIYDQWSYAFVTPNGPGSAEAFHMSTGGDRLWVASGAYSSTWSMTFRSDGLFTFDGFRWRNINRTTDPMLDPLFDYVCVVADPTDPAKVYAGTWDKGLIYLKDQKAVKIYDETNSSLSVLENASLGVYRVAIGGLAFDPQGNLWVTNAGVTRSLSVLKTDGTWQSFDISSPDMKMTDRVSGKVVIDKSGQKWVLIGRGYGIQVFNDNNTLNNTSDDRTTNITNVAGRGGLPSTLVTDLALDLDGRMWIGSDKGIAVIYSPENVFRGYFYDAQQILVNQDGYDQYLLENETVTAIAVDGGNRKWIGTEKSGVFLLSPDGTKELARFHVGNSPLLSNGIRSIAINQANGEVFFATDRGIISYRSDATLGAEVHSEVKVFPNPVRPEFAGAITVSGLVRDADVKITTVGGSVVHSARANGGTVVWNGKDLKGQKVATGVYLVFSSNREGIETAVAKILFIH